MTVFIRAPTGDRSSGPFLVLWMSASRLRRETEIHTKSTRGPAASSCVFDFDVEKIPRNEKPHPDPDFDVEFDGTNHFELQISNFGKMKIFDFLTENPLAGQTEMALEIHPRDLRFAMSGPEKIPQE